MTTPNDLIEASLKKIGVHSKGQSLDAEDLQDALSELNRILAMWKDDGIDIGQAVYTSAATTLTIPLKYHKAIVDTLAVELSPEYGMPVSPVIMQQARRGYEQVLRASQQDIIMDMPSGVPTRQGGFDIDY